MKKIIILMLVVFSTFSFAAHGEIEDGDYFELYREAYNAVETPETHEKIGLKKENIKEVRTIINKGWYDIKMLEAEKLKEIFAIDKLLIDGPGNKEKIDEHLKKIKKINDQKKKIYYETKEEVKKHADLTKL
jgi:hypothetical protein